MHYSANRKLDLVVVLAVFSVTFMLVESTKQSFATIATDISNTDSEQNEPNLNASFIFDTHRMILQVVL